jgi:hypothetical protein
MPFPSWLRPWKSTLTREPIRRIRSQTFRDRKPAPALNPEALEDGIVPATVGID